MLRSWEQLRLSDPPSVRGLAGEAPKYVGASELGWLVLVLAGKNK